jgi:carboxyl-terminal processing protease
MILNGVQALCRSAGKPAPTRLAKRASDVVSADQLASLLTEAWPAGNPSKKEGSAENLAESFLGGMLSGVPGGASLTSTKDAKVMDQFRGNLYVGLHIQAGWDRARDQFVIMGVMEGGPAERAGIKQGDLFESVDGVPTRGRKLREVVDQIRGEEGTDLTVRVCTPAPKGVKGDDVVRTLTLTRRRLFRATVQGIRKRSAGGWEVRVEGKEPLGYLKFEQIEGSTPQELRDLARQLEDEGVKALVLDFRSVQGASFHPTVLTADALLDGGTIGRYRSAEKVETIRAEPDALFAGWPLAVLIDGETHPHAAWLAAALQDNHRAVLVGSPTKGAPVVRNAVPFGDGTWSVEMITGRLDRGDGRPIGEPIRNDQRRDRAYQEARARQGGPELRLNSAAPTGVTPDVVIGPSAGPRLTGNAVAGDRAIATALELLLKRLKPSS